MLDHAGERTRVCARCAVRDARTTSGALLQLRAISGAGYGEEVPRLFPANNRTTIHLVGLDESDLGIGSGGSVLDLLFRNELMRRKSVIENDQDCRHRGLNPPPWIASITGTKSCSSSQSLEAKISLMLGLFSMFESEAASGSSFILTVNN